LLPFVEFYVYINEVTSEEYIEFVSEKYRVLFSYALKLTKHRENAEDLVQEALVKLWYAKDKISRHKNPLSYAYTTIRNIFIDNTRKKKPSEVPIDSIPEENLLLKYAVAKPELNKITEQSTEIFKKVYGIIEAMPETQRKIVLLRDVRGLTNKETAEILKISTDTVKVYLSRARKHIRLKLKNEYNENERN
jgi:RNA polymerase sigma-70 factor (ECF subfamily)